MKRDIKCTEREREREGRDGGRERGLLKNSARPRCVKGIAAELLNTRLVSQTGITLPFSF